MSLTPWVISRIRTFVPVIVGVVVVWLEQQLHAEIDEASVAAAAVGIVTAVYYELVRRLERRWPRLGWLLGYPSPPVYVRSRRP